MKVIDLLNKIANKENLPKKIYYINREFYLKENTYFGDTFTLMHYIQEEDLNEEIEVLEEEKKIPEKLNTWYGIEPVSLDSPTTFKDNSKYIDFNNEMFFDKINEIIDYFKSKGE